MRDRIGHVLLDLLASRRFRAAPGSALLFLLSHVSSASELCQPVK
jgi:hypothetical protein